MSCISAILKDNKFYHSLSCYKKDISNYLVFVLHYGALRNIKSKINKLRYHVKKSSIHKEISYLLKNLEHTNKFKRQDNITELHCSIQNSKAIASLFPKISIITPTLNQGKFIEKSIQSVLSQNYPNYEYIIIDGGSTDNSIEIIKKYEKMITYLISEKDSGQADAINKGLRQASGEIVNWLNSDDYLEPGALYNCAAAYKENPLAAGWIGACNRIDEYGAIINTIYPNGFDRENIGQNWNGRQFYQPSCFLSTVKVKEIEGVNPDLHFAMDLDLWIRMLDKGNFVAGKGVWSNAIIHADAKTQHLRKNMRLETIDIQNKYGFTEGAKNRHRKILNEGSENFVIPDTLQERIAKVHNSNRIDISCFRQPVSITFVSTTLPRFNKTSSNFRVYNIIKILLAGKCRINYIYSSKTQEDNKYMNAFNGDISFTFLPLDQMNYQQTITECNDDHIWITNLWTNSFIVFMTELAKTLKTNKSAVKVIIDTMDFHYKKYLRKYETENQEDDLLLANEYLKNEEALYKIADTVVVVTEQEKTDIEEKFAGINQFAIIPNIHEILEPFFSLTKKPFKERNHICFLGDFNVNQNITAVQYFIKNVFPYILKRNPFIEFHVIGNNSKQYKKEFKFINVKVIGFVENIEKAFKNYKLFVCPLLYGTGIKGKIGSASSAGLPIVTTSIGAEGFPVKDGEECFIADSPTEFADKCNHCLSDPIAWYNFSMKSKLMISEHFSPNVIAEKLMRIFD